MHRFLHGQFPAASLWLEYAIRPEEGRNSVPTYGERQGRSTDYLRSKSKLGEKFISFEREELKRGLLNGDSLEVTMGGGQYEVWVEPYANPPIVYYEGRSISIGDLDEVIGSLLEDIARQEVRCRWLDPRGVQAKSCEEAYRARTAEVSRAVTQFDG